MSKDKTETRKPYANGESSYHEHKSIDWSKPNEETDTTRRDAGAARGGLRSARSAAQR
jgi:hypothetical protein